MFRKGGLSDIKINNSTSNISRLMSSPPQAESTHIENGSKLNGKLTPKRRAVSPLQNSKGITKISNSSPVLSRKIDPQVFTDVHSRGLASRIVKYHEMSKQNERPTIRSNYSKPGEFPIVNLNTKKELPYIIKRNLSSKNPPVRIAPPEKGISNLNYRSSMLRSSGILIKNDNEPLVLTTIGGVNTRTRSVLDELTEISRKRINNEELKIDSIKKTCIEGSGSTDQPDGDGCSGLGGIGLGGNKKRQRDTSFSTSPTSISPTKMDNLHLNKKNCILNKKPSVIKNNDILSSLSSSMIFPNAKLQWNNKTIINHPSIYNTNNVFIQSIERQYNNRLPSFDVHATVTNKANLMHAASSPVAQSTYNTSMVSGVVASNVIAARSEPHKPASQKLLLFNRPEVPQHHKIKVNQISEEPTVNFVKPKQIIDNNLIIEPNKIDENSLVKRKSNLTGIERSKLAMMLEYLKSDEEDEDKTTIDEIDNKSTKFAKSNLSNADLTIETATPTLSSLPLTTSWSTTVPKLLTSNLPTNSSGEVDKLTTLTTTVTTTPVSDSPIVTTKIEICSTKNETQNTSTTSILKPVVTPSVTSIESKPEFVNTMPVPTARVGGFSFSINSSGNSPAPTTAKTETVVPVVSSSLNTTLSFHSKTDANAINTPVSFLSTSSSESQPQTNKTFSFFNKPNTTTSEPKLPAPQPTMTSTLNFSSEQSILPTSTINFSSPQKNLAGISKSSTERISFIAPVQSPPRTGLNVTFGGVVLPTTVKENSTMVPVTTTVSKFSFTTNNTNFTEPTVAATTSIFNRFNQPSFNSNVSDFNGINKPKVQTTMSSLQPVSAATTEPSLLFMQTTGVTAPSVSVVKPFSFSGSNSTAPITTASGSENLIFNNSGNQQNKNMFGNFATAPTTTAPNFSFGTNSVTSTQQNNGFGNTQVTSTNQSNAFGNPQASQIQTQSNNVFGNIQAPTTTTSNNSELTLFNFKTATANNTANQPPAEISSNVFKLRGAETNSSVGFKSQPTNNVFGGGRIQQKNDIFGGGVINNTTKPGSVFNFTSPTTTQANLPPASTFSFAGVNKTQTSPNTNVFGSSNTDAPQPFSFGGASTLNKTQTSPTFGTNNDISKTFTFGQNTAVINSNNNINKPPAFGTNMFGTSNTDATKSEPLKSGFAFGSPNVTQTPSQGMFSFTNNANLGHSNSNLNVSVPAPVFGQAQGQATPQNPFSIGSGTNAARRPVRTAMRRLK